MVWGGPNPVAASACGGLATGYCLAGFQPATRERRRRRARTSEPAASMSSDIAMRPHSETVGMGDPSNARATRMSVSVPMVPPSMSLECQTANQFPEPSVVNCTEESNPESMSALLLSGSGSVQLRPLSLLRNYLKLVI